MSEKSDEATKAWDDDSKEEPAAQSGEAEVHKVDTVPPPASGDAYSADTVIRDVPAEALEAIRERRKTSENRRAAERADEHASTPASTSDRPTPRGTAVASSNERPTVPFEEKLALEKSAAEKSIAEKSDSKKAEPVVHPPARAVMPPVTAGELTIAFAAAVALIVVGFYVIGSAF